MRHVKGSVGHIRRLMRVCPASSESLWSKFISTITDTDATDATGPSVLFRM